MLFFHEAKFILKCHTTHERTELIRVLKCVSGTRNFGVRLNCRSYSTKSSSTSTLSSLDFAKNGLFSSNIYLNKENRSILTKGNNISTPETEAKSSSTSTLSSLDFAKNGLFSSNIYLNKENRSILTKGNNISTPETEAKAAESVSHSTTSSTTTPNPSSSHIPFEIKHLDHSSPRKAKDASFFAPYLALTKPRLSALVILSAMSSYALTPYDATLSQLLFLTIGTALSSGSANAINMAREYEYDAQMTRTRTRPVVRGLISPKQAFGFAGISGTVGVAALYFGVNPTVAALGAANIVLYGWTYTSLKRTSIINTWIGAIVGAIPPLMGWAASSSLADPGAWALAGLLYCWQFPHFNSLSHNIREEYRRAGYVMAAWTNPALNARVALRHSIAMFPLCIALSYFNITDWVYSIDSGILNGWLTFLAYKFWLEQRKTVGPVFDAGSSFYARKLFWGSVLHLPGVLVLAMIHKKGQWDWLWRDQEEEEEEYE